MDRSERVIGLVIRSAPSDGPSSRDQLDVALAAASLGFELELFFTARGIQQLFANTDASAGETPAGHKGWKALPGLTKVLAWADEPSIPSLKDSGINLLLDVGSCSPLDFAHRLELCDQTLVI
jgi:sulfur relay (sulfurtransferase) DsrF/TusC family protein